MILSDRVMLPFFCRRLGHGGAASLALEPSPFITRVFVLDVRKPHGRAASCAEGVDDFVRVRRFLILMNL